MTIATWRVGASDNGAAGIERFGLERSRKQTYASVARLLLERVNQNVGVVA